MKINFSKQLLDVYGKPMVDGADGKTNVLLGSLCISALSATIEADKAEEPKLKFDRFKLACDIANSETKKQAIDLPSESITMLKDRLGRVFANAVVVGSAWTLLDPSEAK